MTDFNAAAERDDRKAGVYANRAVVHALRGDYVSATRDLDRALSLKSSLKEVYESRGVIHVLTGRFDLAVKDFSKAITLGAADNFLYYNRAAALSLLGNVSEAQKDYEKSCQGGYRPACSFSPVLSHLGSSSL